MDQFFDIKSFQGFPTQLTKYVQNVKLDKKVHIITEHLLKSMVIRVIYTKIQTPILEDNSVYGHTFRYIFSRLGNIEAEMKALIEWMENVDVSCRAIDDYLFRNRRFTGSIYVSPGVELSGYRSPGTLTFTQVPNSEEFHVSKEIKRLTKTYGRHGFDPFRRGPIFKWKNYSISICQLHLMYWIRQYDLVKVIKKNRDLKKRPFIQTQS